jgi:NAD(P)-dependent dehydrogenase (short-subunit alcohol dehydrogenase family)
MARRILVTGSASGIGQATVARLQAAGNEVIGVDLRNADIEADLSTAEGRAHMVAEAERLSNGRLDGVLAGAGIANWDLPREIIAINYSSAFGAAAGGGDLFNRADAALGCGRHCQLPGW